MRARVVAGAVGLAAVTTLLAGCTKPLPQVTLQSGSSTYRISPQSWCWDASHCRFDRGTLRTVRAAAGSSVLVDVPKTVADQHWLVSAYTEANGKQTTVDGAGSTVQSNNHTARVDVPQQLVGGSYVLAVKSTDGRIPTGAWGVIVQVTS